MKKNLFLFLIGLMISVVNVPLFIDVIREESTRNAWLRAVVTVAILLITLDYYSEYRKELKKRRGAE